LRKCLNWLELMVADWTDPELGRATPGRIASSAVATLRLDLYGRVARTDRVSRTSVNRERVASYATRVLDAQALVLLAAVCTYGADRLATFLMGDPPRRVGAHTSDVWP
jgi:hypothetical protein